VTLSSALTPAVRAVGPTGFNQYPCKALPRDPPTTGTQSLAATGAGSLAHYDFAAEQLVLAPGFSYAMKPAEFWSTYAGVLDGTAPAPMEGTSSIEPPRLGTWAWTYHWDTQIAEYSDNWGNWYRHGPNLAPRCVARGQPAKCGSPNAVQLDYPAPQYTRENMWNLLLCYTQHSTGHGRMPPGMGFGM